MANVQRLLSPADRPGFIERVGHLWIENPARLVMFALELLRAPVQARNEARRTTLLILLRNIARQIGRTLLRSMIPVLTFGAVLGLAIGAVVGGFGDLVRTFIDTFALRVIYQLVLPILVMIILLARVGSAIAGRLSMYSLAYRARTAAQPKADIADAAPGTSYMSARELLAEVLPLILATVITAGISYWLLALWLMAGYMSDGLPSQILQVLAPSNWSSFGDFIQAKTLGPVLWAGTWWSLGFGVAIAYVAAALGTAAGERISNGSAEPTDYYDAVWESGAMTLLICAVTIALTWKTL